MSPNAEGYTGEVEVRGLRIAYETRGQGSPLLLLHGALGDHRVWRRQLDHLSEVHTVVAWDAPGCGKSSDPEEDLNFSDYADYLAGFIETIGLDRPHVLGLSFGGGLALELYNQYPDIPRSLILASAYAGGAGSLPPEEVEARLEQILRLSRATPEEVVETLISSMFTASVPEDVVEELARIMRDFHPRGTRIMLRAFARADLRGMLGSIHVPTLLIYGDDDERSPLSVARALHEAIPKSQLVVIPDVGHATNLEAPEAFDAAVREFLCELETGD